MHVRRRLLATLLGLVALVAAGCGEEPRDEQAAVSQRLEASPDAKAVELRAELASLLEEEVFLITHAVRSGARAGFDSELYDAAEKELERTTEKLVDTLSPLFDARRKDGFRRRLDRLVDLALGYGREQVEPGRADVAFRREIDESRAALASILADSSRALSEKDLANHLELTLDELLLALDRLGGDRRGQLDHAEAAARFSRGLAGVLAVAVAEDSPEIGGREAATSEPARLYADLRTLLEEDFQLSFAAIQVGLAEGFESAPFRSASLQVDESAKLFSDRLATIPRVGGGHGGAQSDERRHGAEHQHHHAVGHLLRRHWQLVELFAREASAENVAELTKQEIEAALHEVSTSLARLLAERTAVQRKSLAEPPDKADKELLKAIGALVQEDPKAYEHLVKALDHVADAADVLVDGVIFTQVEDPQPEREP